MLALATLAMAVLGMAIARYFVLPLRAAPALNTLLITLMLGTGYANRYGCSIHKAPIRNIFRRCCREDRSISAISICGSTTC